MNIMWMIPEKQNFGYRFLDQFGVGPSIIMIVIIMVICIAVIFMVKRFIRY